MGRTIWPEGYKKQIGVKISPKLWGELRLLAFQQERTATVLLEEAIKEYIENHRDTTKGSVDELPPENK